MSELGMSELAVALLRALDDDALDHLAERLAPRLAIRADSSPAAYTVASLAAALDVTPKTVRGWIARGELRAAKRGGRWLIDRSAVEELGAPQGALQRPQRTPARRTRQSADRRRPLGSMLADLDNDG